MFQCRGGVVSDFDAGRESVKDAVASQHRMTLCRDQHARLRVTKYVVLFENTLGGLKHILGTVALVPKYNKM